MSEPELDYAPPPRSPASPRFNAGRALLTLAALGLWAASFFLPVFREGAPGDSVLRGWEMFLFAVYLAPAIVTLPWLLLNLALVPLSVLNLLGLPARIFGMVMLAGIVFCTAVVVVAQMAAWQLGGPRGPEFLWAGVAPWTAAMVLAGAAALLRGRTTGDGR